MVLSDGVVSVPPQKHYRDHITPHKITLITLIREFCVVKSQNRKLNCFSMDDDSNWFHTNQHNRDMAISLLKLIQSPDMEFKEFNNAVKKVMHPDTYDLLITKLKMLKKGRVTGLMDYINSLESLLLDEPSPNSPVIHKSSVLGLFIRRMILAFDKLSFNHVTQLYEQFQIYCNVASDIFGKDSDMSDATDSIKILEQPCKEFQTLASQRQAEFFIAQQAALLQINEKEALPPPELQQRIRELLIGNPALIEAHYLSFLNTLRIKEYCSAVEYLHRHFDRNTTIVLDSKVTQPSEELSRSYRYAALNLAILHAQFGHKDEALAALKEAIMVAQELNDNICLQHALTWLYRLTDDNVETLIEKSISKSGELNLWCLSSLGIENLTQIKCVTTASPSNIFDLVMKSDIFNCQHSMTENMGSAYAQRAALWAYYGNSCMSVLVSQLLLYLNTSDPVRGGVYHVGEGTCLALRNIIMSFAGEGKFAQVIRLLNLTKKLFPPHSDYSDIWKLCELVIRFEGYLYCGLWSKAEQVICDISIINPLEKNYRKAELFIHQGNLVKAHSIVKDLIAKYEKNDLSPHFYVRVLLLKANILHKTSNFSLAIPCLLQCLEITKLHHLLYLNALAMMHLAGIQLLLNLPHKALELLDSIFSTIMSHGSSYDKGCCYLLYAKCCVASLQQIEYDELERIFLPTVNLVTRSIEFFLKVKAVHKAKYALCWQAELYDQVNMRTERNSCAKRFRNLDQEFPYSNWNGLLIP